MYTTPSLPLEPALLSFRVSIPVRVPSRSQIDLGVLLPVRVPFRGQIDLFQNDSYSIGSCTKILLRNNDIKHVNV